MVSTVMMPSPEIIGWLLLGLLAGGLARALVPGQDRAGCLPTMLLGIAGAFVGGWLGRKFDILPPADPHSWLPSWRGVVTATVGASILLGAFRLLRK